MTMQIPDKVKKQIKTHDPEAQVLLFGSRARGDYHTDSDWDFLILVSDHLYSKAFKYQLWDELYQLELQYDVVITGLIHAKGEWAKRKITPLYETIAKDGIEA
jgi:predicted nucleotidyltransferase